MKEMNNEEYLIVYKDQANEKLVEELKKFRNYIFSSEQRKHEPEWKQLYAIGGFVVNVVKALKWEMSAYTFYDIWTEIQKAIDYTLSSPYADELNSMWQDYHTGKTNKYDNVENVWEMYNIIFDKLEKRYPGLEETVKKYFDHDD